MHNFEAKPRDIPTNVEINEEDKFVSYLMDYHNYSEQNEIIKSLLRKVITIRANSIQDKQKELEGIMKDQEELKHILTSGKFD